MKTQLVSIVARKNNAFPSRLQVLADGRVIKIDAVERCWTETLPNRSAVSYIFRVRSGTRRYRLLENIVSGHCFLYSDG